MYFASHLGTGAPILPVFSMIESISVKTSQTVTMTPKSPLTGGQNRKWGEKHFGLIASELQPDEDVLMAFIGLHNYQSMTKHDSNYAYAVTNKRILMGQKKLVGQALQSVMLDQVNDVPSSTCQSSSDQRKAAPMAIS